MLFNIINFKEKLSLFKLNLKNRFLFKTQKPKKFLAKESLFDLSSLYKI
jgi:hypothetical protein